MLGVTNNQTHFIIESEMKEYEGWGESGLHGEKLFFLSTCNKRLEINFLAEMFLFVLHQCA